MTVERGNVFKGEGLEEGSRGIRRVTQDMCGSNRKGGKRGRNKK